MQNNMQKYRIFTKTSWDKPAALFYLLLLFTAILYSAMFTPPHTALMELSGKDSALATLLTASCVLPLFFVIFLSKWATVILMPLLFYIGTISNMYSEKLGEHVTPLNAPMFFNTNAVVDIVSNTGSMFFVIAMFMTGIAVGAIRLMYTDDNITVRKGQMFAAVLILCFGSVNLIRDKFPTYIPMPYIFFTSMQDYAKMQAYSLVADNEAQGITATATQDDRYTVVVLLDKFADVVFTADNNTLINNENIITAEYVHEQTPAVLELEHLLTYDNTSLLHTFKNANVPTEWINISNSLKANNSITYKYAHQADNYTFIDNSVFPNPFLAVDKVKEFMQANKNGLIIINIEGTPKSVESRYPSTFENGESYANYTSFIDGFLYETIHLLDTHDATLVAVPLSGEATQGFENTSAIFWQSNKTVENRLPNNISSILKTGDLFYAILGCSSINTDNKATDKSLCN